MAGEGMRYSSGAISTRTNVYAEREMLRHAAPVMVLEKLATAKSMPKNKTDTVKFRRPVPFTAKTTPLVEGITPDKTSFAYEDVSVSLRQYGDVIEITDVIEDLHEDPVGKDIALQAGENIGRTMEALDYGIVRAGTNVFYANGTSRTDVNTPISLAKQRAVIRGLKAQKAMKHTSILSSSTSYATRAIEASYIAVTHTDVEADIRNIPGFIPVAQYGQRSTISEHEIGAVEDVRYVLSPDLDPIDDAGGAKLGMVSTTGTSADVYPVMYFGKESWARVALRGHGSVSPSIIPVGQKTKDDPLGQRGYVGWKTWHAALILNQLWMARLEVAVTNL
jgi:N4-gp56 family major capsid protein